MRVYVYEGVEADQGYITAVVAVSDRELQEADTTPGWTRRSVHGLDQTLVDAALLTREELLQEPHGRVALDAWEAGDDSVFETENLVRDRVAGLGDLERFLNRCKTTKMFLTENRTIDELSEFMKTHRCELDDRGICRTADMAAASKDDRLAGRS